MRVRDGARRQRLRGLATPFDPLQPRYHTLLPRRELQVLNAIAHGHTTPDIAVELGLSVHTITEYRKRIRITLGARTTPHAIHIAHQKHLLD